VLTVRDARPDDAAEVAGVHVRSWQVAYRGLLPDDYLDGLRAEDRAARYTFHLVGPTYPATSVAVEEGVIRGFVTTGPARDEAATVGAIYALYVDREQWGRGVGRLLMTRARSRLVRHGFTDALLWVLTGNERAERFYRADGWLPDGRRRDDDVWGIRVGETCYRRQLP
jgi:GNAT superfamily N-acetyltransferase